MTALQTSHSKTLISIPVVATALRQARQRLLSNCYSEIRELCATLREGELTINGVVRSFYLKQIAQTIVRDIQGVEKVTNNVSVVYPQTTREQSQ